MLSIGRLLFVFGALMPLLLLSCDSEEEQVQDSSASPQGSAVASTPPEPEPTATPSPVPVPPGYAKYRWGNVTVVVPEGIVSVGRWVGSKEENPPDGGLVINLVQGDIVSASVLVDAIDGHIVRESENVPPELRDAISTVRLNEPMGKVLPWPLGEFPSEAATPIKEVSGQISFLRPEPASGIELYEGCGVAENLPAGSHGCFVEITDGSSRLFVDSATGELTSRETSTEDAVAFDRWLASVESVSP